MSARHAAADSSRPGDGLVRAGAVVFLVGLVATFASVVPAVLRDRPAPIELVVAAGSLLPLGFAIALVGLLRQARTRRREASRRRH